MAWIWRDHDSATSDSGGVLPTVPERHGSWIKESRPAWARRPKLRRSPSLSGPRSSSLRNGLRSTSDGQGSRNSELDAKKHFLILVAQHEKCLCIVHVGSLHMDMFVNFECCNSAFPPAVFRRPQKRNASRKRIRIIIR